MSRVYRIADLFCGAGGSSTGAVRAIETMGGSVDLVAVNHWDTAIATHTRNHPRARHYCINLDSARPAELVPGGHLHLLMASPECVHFSQARGGKPVSDQRRASAWLINKWLTDLRVDALLVENVPEFVRWGPLCTLADGHEGDHRDDGDAALEEQCRRPVPAKKSIYFEAWWRSLILLGYEVEWRTLNAADYGDATTRRRFFLQARRGARRISWPTASHGRAGTPELLLGRKKWRAAREIIDWTKPGRSILDRKKPLSINTRRRIARGLEQFCGPLAPLYVALLDLEPQPSREAGDVEPSFIVLQRDSGDVNKQPTPSRPRSTGEPLPTITAAASVGLVEPVAVILGNRAHSVATGPDEPIPTATTAPGGGIATVEASAFLLAQASGGIARSVDDPAPTILGGGAISITEPHISPYYGHATPSSIDAPVPTVTTKDRHGLVEPHISPFYSQSGSISVDQPLGTVTGCRHHGLVEPLVVPYGPTADARSAAEPLPTILTKDRLGVAEFVLNRHSHPQPRDVDEPLPTCTGSGGGYLVEPFIVPNFGENGAQLPRVHSIDDPAPTATGRGAGNLILPAIDPAALEGVDPRRLVWIDDGTGPKLCKLDIRFRMLHNDELARAMGFHDGGRYDFVGKPEDVTTQIGNAVAVNQARALVLAILGEDPAGEAVA